VEYVLADPIGSTLVNTVNVHSQSPLHVSLFDILYPERHRRPRPGTVLTLLRAGAQASLETRHSRDALAHYLAAEPSFPVQEVVRMLLEYGANAEFQQNGRNLAHTLIGRRIRVPRTRVDVQVLDILRHHGVPLNVVDRNGRSILHRAAVVSKVSTELLEYLHGVVDPLARDCYSKTALDYMHDELHKYHIDTCEAVDTNLDNFGKYWPILTLKDAKLQREAREQLRWEEVERHARWYKKSD